MDLAIVGGGLMGLSTAWAAAKRGARVTLVDPRPTINEHSASNDESKVFRIAYGRQRNYVQLAKKALVGWRALEEDSGRAILHQTGLLMFGPPGGFHQQSARTLLEMGERVQIMKGPFPGFHGIEEAVLDPLGGWLDPRAALRALEERALAHGAHIRRDVGAKAVRAGGVTLDDGSVLSARAVVVTAGFHAPRILPWLRGKIRVTRQPELFFDVPSDFPETATFAAFEEGFYGFPRRDGAVKVADHHKGPLVTDFEHRPPASAKEVATARAWLAKRMPELAQRPLARQRVCLYDNTSNDDFLLQKVDGVTLGAGFSGHGFKFGPAIGEHLADLAL
ncbi:MAG TPA: FAD-dependent oxidoreductase [Candidatus Thermoplasmatota archaeon]|nr:FAD-dependent oxidoreductase [Candidatus Thermoplasmatota archaeon]